MADVPPPDSLDPTVGFDPDPAIERIERFIRRTVEAAEGDGLVVNLSGGLDSTVAATLAADALGPDRVSGWLLPCNLGAEAATHDARAVANGLGIEHTTVHLQPLLDAFLDRVPTQLDYRDEAVALGNVIARLRMVCAYFVANTTNRLVVGTTNRSEWLLGHVTKHGDGAGDLFPLGELYKTQVRVVGTALDVPDFVRDRSPRAGLWAGQTDEAELGAPYQVIDCVLRGHLERDLSASAIAESLDIEESLVCDLISRYHDAAHKRGGRTFPGRND